MRIFKPNNERDKKPAGAAGIYVNLLADLNLPLESPRDSVPVHHQILILEPGGADQYHYHEATWEIFTIQEGRANVLVNGQEIVMNKDDVLVTEPRDCHRFSNTGNRPVTIIETRINPHPDDRSLVCLTQT